MHMPSEKPYQWWRWPLMPFAAFSGAVAGTLLIALIMWAGMKLQGGYSEDGWYYRYILPLITSGIFGHIFAKIAYHVAPSGKLIAAVVMVTLLGLLGVLSAVIAWYLPSYSTGQAIQSTVGCAAMLFGSVIALADPD